MVKYNQRFSVIVEIGSFGLVLPVQESSLSLWHRDTKANRERRGGRKVGGDVPRWAEEIPESNYPLFHSMLPFRPDNIGFSNGDILDKSDRTEFTMKLPVPKFRIILPNWPHLIVLIILIILISFSVYRVVRVSLSKDQRQFILFEIV